MSEELKPCPFCGSDEIETFYNRSVVDHYTCQYCGASAKNWNSRHESDELPEWVRKAIETKIEKGREKQDKITRVGPSIEREFWYNIIEALKWVLSIRRGEE